MDKTKLENLFENLSKPLILDGAMGSLIQQKGYPTDKHLWTSYLNFKYPQVISEIHKDYIKAGCDILTTNTFRTNPLAIKNANFGLDISEAVKLSVELSKKVAENNNVLLAGSNAPVEDCYQVERRVRLSEIKYNHEKHIELLYNNGVDFILNETQSHFDEIEIICRFCSDNNIPYIISLFVTSDLKLLSGENITEAVELIKSYNPLLISFNCFSDSVFLKLIKVINLNFRWGFYLNCGSGEYTDKEISCGLDENRYAEIVKSSLSLKPKLIGACCGSNPNHIKSIKNLLDEEFSV